jgi:hypothetical protein
MGNETIKELYKSLFDVGFGNIRWSGKGTIGFGSSEIKTKDAILLSERLSESLHDLQSAIRKDIFANGVDHDRSE